MMIARPSVVLHIEDEDIFHLAVEEGFEDAGIKLDLWRARDGGEALEILRDKERVLPDLILLDLYMHPMDGFGFLRAVKDCPKKLKIVILTTSGDEKDRIEAMGTGAPVHDYLRKPAAYTDLVKILSELGHCISSCDEGECTCHD